MVENDKEMGSNEPVNSNTNTTHAQSISPYNWMLDGESVLTEMPVKYVIYLVRAGNSSNGGQDRLNVRGPKYAKRKTDIVKIIATDRRVVFIDKKGELFHDKSRVRIQSGQHGPRQFFFYDKAAFDGYLEYASDHNKKLISDFKSKNPKFEKFFNKYGAIGKYRRNMEREGYISTVYFANELNLTTQKDYLKGNVNKGKAYRILHAIARGGAPTWFFDAKKRGVQIKGKELNIIAIETSKALADRGMNYRSHLINLLTGKLLATDFFIRIDKNQIDDMIKLIDSISVKIVEMNDYTDKKAAKNAVYEKYLNPDKSEEQ